MDTINETVNAALQTPDIRARIAALGMDPAGGSPKQFAAIIPSETAMWAEVVKSAGLKVEK